MPDGGTDYLQGTGWKLKVADDFIRTRVLFFLGKLDLKPS